MAIERVDFPIKNGGFSIAMLVHQRVTFIGKPPFQETPVRTPGASGDLHPGAQGP